MQPSLEPIDRYQPVEVLGSGAFGTVYRARHMHTGEVVALKVLHEPAGELGERALREARALAGFVHPNVVRVLDCGLGPRGQIFVAMELAQGVPLTQLLGAPMPPARAVAIACEVLDGLAAVHARGIVHRDIKPSNLVVDVWSMRPDAPGRATDRVRIVDFGISRIATGTLPSPDARGRTKTGMALGTPGYMAPEQLGAAHQADARADLYSVAVILYQLLSGQMPHPATTYEDYVVSVRTKPPSSVRSAAPHVWPSLESAVMRGLAADAAARFATAAEFRAALAAAIADPVALSFAPTGSALMPPGGAAPPPSAAYGAPSPALLQVALAPGQGRGRGGAVSGAVPAFAGPSTWDPASVAGPAPRRGVPVGWVVGLALALFMALGLGIGAVVLLAGDRSGEGPASASVAPPSTLTGEAGEASGERGSTPTPSPTAVATSPSRPSKAGVVTPQPAVAPAASAAAPPTAPAVAPVGPTSCGSLSVVAAQAAGVRVGAGTIVGEADAKWLADVARLGAPSLTACRRASCSLVRASLFLQPDGSITLAVPANDNKGDPDVAKCVASMLKATAPRHGAKLADKPSSEPHGIASFSVLLDPR